MILNVNFLPARYGDSIWIEYGDPSDPAVVLIDGGTGGTRRDIEAMIEQLPGKKHIDLLVVTHIDRDHIEGILALLEESPELASIGEIWFNGWQHLPGNESVEAFGSRQGEKLSAAILKNKIPWNEHFSGKAIVSDGEAKYPVIELKNGFRLTILSPTIKHLADLKPAWVEELKKANLLPGFGLEQPKPLPAGTEKFGAAMPDVEELCSQPFEEDDAVANGSSIAFLAEFQQKRILFCGDAFPSVLLNSLHDLYEENVPIDLVKLSHHASAGNTSPELLMKLNCKRFVISTNGSNYYHPAPVTVARVIKLKGEGTELFFNYRTAYNEIWDNTILKMKYGYRTVYPITEGITVELI